MTVTKPPLFTATHTGEPHRRYAGDRGIRGHVYVPGSTKLIAATDGSWKNGIGGHGYVTYNGHWGIAGRRVRGPLNPIADHHTGVLVTELRAVGAVLEDFPGRRVRFLIDSLDAIDYLRAWQLGDTDRMPPGYSLRPRVQGGAVPALVRFAELVCGRTDLRFVHVSAHAGHRMNDVADRLASLGRRATTGRFATEQDVADIATTIVTAFVMITRGGTA